ncbi:uncharacterized protein LOC134291940 [Aedes albopictus]|uniref:Reverse transcriptase domain-containing protein n=1 Tax=Aedes albopictus TaxID=7160 RepID=A0ABM1XT53_AEDAL
MCSPHNIRDSFTFASEINRMKIPENHVVVSFDVISLFTNIPKELVIQGIFRNWEKIKRHTQINLDLFQELVAFCLDTSYFMFRAQVYHQQFGTAMGSPLSPILADMVLDELIDTVVQRLDYVINFLKKYVDDFFLVLPRDKVDYTLQVFNSYNEHLQFTVEVENENKLPFLDVVVIRGDDQMLSTEWYAKPIASGRLVNYFSYHPLPQKMNVITNFINRVITLSPKADAQTLKKIVHTILRNNNYPTNLINRIFHRTLSHATAGPPLGPTSNSIANNVNSMPHHIATHTTTASTANTEATSTTSTATHTTTNAATSIPTAPDPDQNTCTPTAPSTHPTTDAFKYVSLPYIPQLSQSISRCLQQEYPTVKIANRKVNTVGHLHTRVKDRIDPMQQHNVIYQIPCSDCNQVYIGMTTNKLRKRLSGHQSNINQLNRLRDQGYTNTDQAMIQQSSKTALTEHCVKEDHRFALQQTKILDKTHNRSTLPLLECFHIYNTHRTVNHRTDVEGLSSIYCGLLRTIAAKQVKRTQTNPLPPQHPSTSNPDNQQPTDDQQQ